MALPVSYNVRSLLVRWKTSLLAMFGIGLVVTVFIVLLAMVSGFRLVLRATGLPDNGIVTQRGSNSELTSWLTKDNADVISVDGRVAREKDGQPMASCEMVVITALPRQNNGQLANVTVRGVTPKAFDVRGGLNFVQGRNFTPGLDEIIVGKQIQQRVKGLDLGSKVRMQNRDWTVVGIFAADGNSFESEIWGDYNVMGPAFMRQGGCESLTVRLTSAAVISGFDKDLRANPQMQVKLDPERKYYEDQAGPVAGPRFRAHSRSGDVARAWFLQIQYSVQLCSGVSLPGTGWRIARLPAGDPCQRIQYCDRSDRQLQRNSICFPNYQC